MVEGFYFAANQLRIDYITLTLLFVCMCIKVVIFFLRILSKYVFIIITEEILQFKIIIFSLSYKIIP